MKKLGIFVKYYYKQEIMKDLLLRMGKYNLWENTSLDTGYFRHAYLNNIKKYLGNKLVKVIVGQRRSGKSYLLRQIMKYLTNELQVNPVNIFYLNKEFTIFDEIAVFTDLENLLRLYRQTFNISGKVYIFLDEVQNIRSWEKFVNSFSQDFTEDYEIFISGSNSTLLSGELSTLLSGRYVQFEVLPFSYMEYVDYLSKPVNKETFLEYLKNGGLPEMLHLPDHEVKAHYISDLKNTIVIRDIIQRRPIKDFSLFEDLFNYLCLNIGNLTSLNSIVKYLKSKQIKTNYETLARYAGYLSESYIFHQAIRYDLRGKQALGGLYKYYLNDLSFKNFMFGLYPADMGYHLENLVYLELIRRGYQVTIGVLDKKEIDFIATRPDKTIYIQVAWVLGNEDTIAREFNNLLAVKDNYEKLVVSMDDIRYSDYKGIGHVRPWELDV